MTYTPQNDVTELDEKAVVITSFTAGLIEAAPGFPPHPASAEFMARDADPSMIPTLDRKLQIAHVGADIQNAPAKAVIARPVRLSIVRN